MRAVTSASNIHRRKLCPGSHNAEANVIDDTSSAPADEGKLLHPFAQNPKLKRDHLTDKQRALLEKADRSTKDLLLSATTVFLRSPGALYTEVEGMLYGPDGEELFPGTSDFVQSFEIGAVVQDFKMGFVEVEEAPSNYQLASYGVMWGDYLQVLRVIVAVNQPRAFGKGLTSAIYDAGARDAARREIAAIYHAALDKNAPRIAGETQCRFCKAKLFCDEYKKRFTALDIRPESQTIATLDSDELKRFAVAVKCAKSIERQVMDEMRRRIESGEITDWKLKETGETRELTDVVGAYKELAAYFEEIGGFTGAKFTECTSVTWTKLTKLVQELSGFSQSRAAALLNDLLNPYITRKPKTPSPTPIE